MPSMQNPGELTPFIVLNCANMNPDRLEIELFGINHTANSPTFGSKVGVFERAHTGTLFLMRYLICQ